MWGGMQSSVEFRVEDSSKQDDLTVTLVRLAGKGKADEKLAKCAIQKSELIAAYANEDPNKMPPRFSVELANSDSITSTLELRL